MLQTLHVYRKDELHMYIRKNSNKQPRLIIRNYVIVYAVFVLLGF